MSSPFFSEAWLDDFVERTDEVPLPERVENELADARDDYWEYMDEIAENASGTFALILQSGEDEETPDRYAYFTVQNGSIEEAHLGDADDPSREDCFFVFGGTEQEWSSALDGPRTIEQHIMYRNLMVREGSYHLFFRLWGLIAELFQAGFRAPVTFPPEPG